MKKLNIMLKNELLTPRSGPVPHGDQKQFPVSLVRRRVPLTKMIVGGPFLALLLLAGAVTTLKADELSISIGSSRYTLDDVTTSVNGGWTMTDNSGISVGPPDAVSGSFSSGISTYNVSPANPGIAWAAGANDMTVQLGNGSQTWNFTIPDPSTITDQNPFKWDGLSVQETPEPGSGSLLGLGTLSLLACARRRKAKV